MKKFLFLFAFISAVNFGFAQQAKYVFYFIGDGMGVNQVQGTELYRGELEGKVGIVPINFAQFPYGTTATTFSATNRVTDSAAGGTALATGYKTSNGTIGMIASQNSTATNATNGQITMNYLGSKDNHGVIGMYADTSSTIINNGSITGQDQSTSTSAGTMTGMRGQIVNQENPPYSKTNVQNNGTIQLGINANNREVQTSLVGMGSWIEDEFLNGSMLLSRAGFVYLDNLGKIVLNVALSGTGTYNAASEDGTSYLLQGIGGIVSVAKQICGLEVGQRRRAVSDDQIGQSPFLGQSGSSSRRCRSLLVSYY